MSAAKKNRRQISEFKRFPKNYVCPSLHRMFERPNSAMLSDSDCQRQRFPCSEFSWALATRRLSHAEAVLAWDLIVEQQTPRLATLFLQGKIICK